MTRPHDYGFRASGSVAHLNPWNAERARSEAEKCARRIRICLDAGEYDAAREMLAESKAWTLKAIELEELS